MLLFVQFSLHLHRLVQTCPFLKHLQNLDSLHPVVHPQSVNSRQSLGAGGTRQYKGIMNPSSFLCQPPSVTGGGLG